MDGGDKQIDALLSEYEACHRNRNHYDSLRWTVGSILLVASLTLLGASFTKEVAASSPVEMWFIALFSLAVLIGWYIYFTAIGLNIYTTFVRFLQIELELLKKGINISLHTQEWDNRNESKITRYSGWKKGFLMST